jgi:hypothetical protein
MAWLRLPKFLSQAISQGSARLGPWLEAEPCTSLDLGGATFHACEIEGLAHCAMSVLLPF